MASTIIKRIHLKENKLGYKLYIKINSYKDNSITVDITDTDGFEILENELIVKDYKHIENIIINPVKKILRNNKCILEYDNKDFYSEINKSIKQALKFNGNMTADYHTHLCHSMVVLGNYPDENKNNKKEPAWMQ